MCFQTDREIRTRAAILIPVHEKRYIQWVNSQKKFLHILFL